VTRACLATASSRPFAAHTELSSTAQPPPACSVWMRTRAQPSGALSSRALVKWTVSSAVGTGRGVRQLAERPGGRTSVRVTTAPASRAGRRRTAPRRRVPPSLPGQRQRRGGGAYLLLLGEGGQPDGQLEAAAIHGSRHMGGALPLVGGPRAGRPEHRRADEHRPPVLVAGERTRRSGARPTARPRTVRRGARRPGPGSGWSARGRAPAARPRPGPVRRRAPLPRHVRRGRPPTTTTGGRSEPRRHSRHGCCQGVRPPSRSSHGRSWRET